VRALQEDSYGVIASEEFAGDPNDLFLVVADGMGGHSAGEVASMLAVNAFAETFFTNGSSCDAGRLWDCLEEANHRISNAVATGGKSVEGMGTTLLAVFIRKHAVRWISVGDSPLYLIRGQQLQRLNAIHSRGAELDALVQVGRMTEQQALSDPTRNVLISALIGEKIYEVDDPPAFKAMPGDVIVAATDGIETLSEREIVGVVSRHPTSDASVIAKSIIDAVLSKQSPKQDNTTIIVVRVDSSF
jgi:serine/threonine protein phosphatase PrpC